MTGKMMKTDSREVYFIEGDGIGPEIWNTARPILDAAIKAENGLPIIWKELFAGGKALKETGEVLPKETWDALKNATYAIKGPLTTPVGSGIRSLNVALRQGLDLYACIRPIEYMPGIESPVKHPENVNMIIFRENTEDVYAGIEFDAQTPEAKKLSDFLRDELGIKKIPANSAIGIKPMSESASKRLVRKAIKHAIANNLPSVTLVHKGNIMKFTEGGFRKWGYEVALDEFPLELTPENTLDQDQTDKIIIKDRIADAMFQEALINPQNYSVIASPNLNGDYLSDALAAQVGGLGLAPGVNMSDSLAFFEATHGSAPDIAGKDMANPGSILLCGAMLLEEMGEKKAGQRVRNALKKAIAQKKVPADLAKQMTGATSCGCREFGEIILRNL